MGDMGIVCRGQKRRMTGTVHATDNQWFFMMQNVEEVWVEKHKKSKEKKIRQIFRKNVIVNGDASDKPTKTLKKSKIPENSKKETISSEKSDIEEVKPTKLPILKFNEEKHYTDLTFSPKSWLKRWETTIEKIRSKKNFLAENNLTQNEVDKVQREVLLLICNLRKLNREVQYKLRERRDLVKSTSIACDQEDVQLQNVIYEQKHLSKEADTCLKFKSRHRDFSDLVSLDDVIKNSGLSIEAIEELKLDQHKGTVARLELELKQRQE